MGGRRKCTCTRPRLSLRWNLKRRKCTCTRPRLSLRWNPHQPSSVRRRTGRPRHHRHAIAPRHRRPRCAAQAASTSSPAAKRSTGASSVRRCCGWACGPRHSRSTHSSTRLPRTGRVACRGRSCSSCCAAATRVTAGPRRAAWRVRHRRGPAHRLSSPRRSPQPLQAAAVATRAATPSSTSELCRTQTRQPTRAPPPPRASPRLRVTRRHRRSRCHPRRARSSAPAGSPTQRRRWHRAPPRVRPHASLLPPRAPPKPHRRHIKPVSGVAIPTAASPVGGYHKRTQRPSRRPRLQ